jgi:hypothetical protein
MESIEFNKALLLQIECELHGMVAENKQREHRHQSMAYVMIDFQVLIDQIARIIKER